MHCQTVHSTCSTRPRRRAQTCPVTFASRVAESIAMTAASGQLEASRAAPGLGLWWADGMPSLISSTWHLRSSAARPATGLSYGAFLSLTMGSLIFLAFSWKFLAAGAEFAKSKWSAKSDGPYVRTQFFHYAFAGIASLLAAVRLGIVGSEGRLDPSLALCLGRAGACGLLALALGRAAGAATREVAPVAVLFMVSWLQLGLSAISSQMPLHWGLFCSGGLSAAVAAQSLDAVLESSHHSDDVKDRLSMVMSMVLVLTELSLLVWLTTGMRWRPAHEDVAVEVGSFFTSAREVSTAVTGTFCGYALDSLLDLLWFCGTGHLFLKKHALLDSICQQLSEACPFLADGAADHSDASSQTTAGLHSRSESSESSDASESPPLDSEAEICP